MLEARRPARRLLLAAGVVKANKEQIRKATRRCQDLYDRLGVNPLTLMLSEWPGGGDDGQSPGPDAA